MKTAYFRFYEELNDFLPKEKRKVRFEHHFIDRASVKDMIESLGVPHSEIDLILVNRKSVGFSYLVNDKDEISVYPVFESFDISSVQHLRPKPLREPKFVVDVHLGKLARYLRILGFDTLYKNNYSNNDFIKISLNEKRTILTKDKQILKRNDITHGYWVRNNNIEEQLKEIVKRFNLKNRTREFTRCVDCNSLLIKVKKKEIIDQLPPKVNDWHNKFYFCQTCKKPYWQGSHYKKIKLFVERIMPEI